MVRGDGEAAGEEDGVDSGYRNDGKDEEMYKAPVLTAEAGGGGGLVPQAVSGARP